ncbi:MAG TPA: N-6 DNA methylase, partial [Ktedonobacteraceae bacterium]|nr:N-6 DNA methylase [Ktedonobacteraceae bacterium]
MGKGVSHRVTVRRPQTLAACLADFARQVRELVLADLQRGAQARLAALYEQARREITPALTLDEFADLLAQALVYVLLLARRTSQERAGPFAEAIRALLRLPALPPFVHAMLKTLWRDSARGADELVRCVRELASFLMRTDLRILLEKLRPLCLQGDPLIYFYEIFLTAYAPRQRSQRGVYYTPEPVITYMVRSIDELLREKFGYADGLAGALLQERREDGVVLCDPACGIGAFLWAVLERVRRTTHTDDAAARVLPRLVGCEITPSAYLLASLELAVRHEAWWAGEAAPARLFLTNALAEARLPELSAADLPVILGNPPYAGHSLNHSQRLGRLLESYKLGDADLKRPAQAKWLSDDYVQFLRLAQWQVEQAGRGIVAFLTNHSYLDNPTFRAMRLSLLRSFDEIYILDLHGNSKRRELAPDGEPDRNIFTIQQGVAIGLFVKYARSPASAGFAGTPPERTYRRRQAAPLAGVYHADVWGQRAVYATGMHGARQLSGGKLGWLAEHTRANTPWQICHP